MVKKFKYRLERVLAYRELVKDEKLKELLLRNKRLSDAEQRLGELEAAMLLNRVNANLAMAAEEIKTIGEYSERLKSEIEHQNLEILDARQAVEEAREVFIEASRDAETLQRHKQNKRDDYLEYVRKEEEKFLDEVVTQRAGLTKRTEE